MMKKNTSVLVFIFFILSISSYTQSYDSVEVSKKINKIETDIQKVYQNAIIQNENTEKISEEINNNYKNQLEELKKLHALLEKNSNEFEIIQQKLSELDSTTTKNSRKIKLLEIRNSVFQFILLGLLIFLIVYVIRFRRQSLDYLLIKANDLADQNDTIIEKAEELKSIKTTLNQLIVEQNKKKKQDRKSKRKKKKK